MTLHETDIGCKEKGTNLQIFKYMYILKYTSVFFSFKNADIPDLLYTGLFNYLGGFIKQISNPCIEIISPTVPCANVACLRRGSQTYCVKYKCIKNVFHNY